MQNSMFRPQVLTFFTRRFSFNFFKFWSNSCEKVDCTKPIEPVQKYVIQKSCCRSIFETWKPKVPELTARNYPTIKKNMMLPYEHKTCTSGMKFRDKNRCEIEAVARQCQKMNHPKWVRTCPALPRDHADNLPPPIKAAFAQCKESKGILQKSQIMKSLRQRCEGRIPEADWNPDGQLQ